MILTLNYYWQIMNSRGNAVFKSDNITTIAILKDILSKEATTKKIKLDISSSTLNFFEKQLYTNRKIVISSDFLFFFLDINEQSVTSTLQFLNSKLEKYFKLQQQSILLEALKDIDSAQTEPIQNILIEEYKHILEKEKEICVQLQQRPFYLERLQSMII